MVGARPGVEEFPDADDVAGDAVPVPVGGADDDVEVRMLSEEVVGGLDGFFLACVSITVGMPSYLYLPCNGGDGFELGED